MNFQICFTCPDRFCELLPGDLGSSAIFLQDLVGQALASFPLPTVVIAVELDFRIPESTYLVQIHIRSNARLGAIPYDWDTLRLEIECIISQVMLQCFWEIRYSECRDCPE
jgi:hypothetical protein